MSPVGNEPAGQSASWIDVWTPEPGWTPPPRSTFDPSPWIGAVSDIGLRHHVNQDAVSLHVVPSAQDDDPVPKLIIAAISDGVSSAPDSELAAAKAAATACELVTRWFSQHPSDEAQLLEGFGAAFREANSAVLRAAPDRHAGSCTLIVALIEHQAVTVGNIGDSRAYWVGDDGAHGLLSVDDSVAQARIELGVSREEAERGMHAHAITRWLGPSATDLAPRMIRHEPASPGWVIVCSDGLWNYASEPAHMAALVASEASGRTAVQLAASLVDWANAQGGQDNITVAAVRVPLVTHADAFDGADEPTQTLPATQSAS